jgi:hypothetical protein
VIPRFAYVQFLTYPASGNHEHEGIDADRHTDWEGKRVQDHVGVFYVAGERRISQTLATTDYVAYYDINAHHGETEDKIYEQKTQHTRFLFSSRISKVCEGLKDFKTRQTHPEYN